MGLPYRVIHVEISEIETLINQQDKDGFEFIETIVTGNTGMCRMIFKRIETPIDIMVDSSSGIETYDLEGNQLHPTTNRRLWIVLVVSLVGLVIALGFVHL